MNHLESIGIKWGTDKATHHKYTSVYESLFDKIKDDTINFLEIGLLQYASIKMWEEYFSNAKIWGVDIELREPVTAVSDRVKLVKCDATSPDLLLHLPDKLDIVIDDGSHMSADHIATFELLYPHVNPGGFYIIEDTHVQHVSWKKYSKFNSGVNSLQWLKEQTIVPQTSISYGVSQSFLQKSPSLVIIQKPNV